MCPLTPRKLDNYTTNVLRRMIGSYLARQEAPEANKSLSDFVICELNYMTASNEQPGSDVSGPKDPSSFHA